jgi:P27 family predicted phage terminase small subunit
MAAPRKPAETKRLQGTARRDRERSAPRPSGGVRAPRPPADLSEEARKHWSKLAPICMRLGVLGEADLVAFRLLTETLGTASAAEAAIKADGITVTAGSGGKKAHPALKMLETARNQATRMLIEFGLTPRARQAVGLPAGPRVGGTSRWSALDAYLATDPRLSDPDDDASEKYFADRTWDRIYRRIKQ